MIQREASSAHALRNAGRPAGPMRMCVGCRGRELAVDLLRVVARYDGNGSCVVTVDEASNLPGRGAWLHPDRKCLREAIRRRAFGRALRITGTPPDTSAVVEYVSALADSTSSAREQVAKNMSTP